MNYRIIANIIGRILCVEAGFMVPAAAVSLGYRGMGCHVGHSFVCGGSGG